MSFPSALLKLVRRLMLLAAILAALAAGFLWYVGAWRVVFPSTHHNDRQPFLPGDLRDPAVLVFSKTNQFRHTESIERGSIVIRNIGIARGWDVFLTENGAVFNAEQLSRFKAAVFLNATGDMLSYPQERAFQDWLEAGGGWVGVHAAGDGSHTGWQWYMDNLLGVLFTAHIMGPQFQIASVITENPDHPVAAGLPAVWDHEEEWYSWAVSPRTKGFNVIASVDESSYTPVQKFLGQERDLRMGDHPIAWSNCIGEGRAIYTALGHKAESYDNPTVRQLLENAIAWALGESEGGCL